MDVRAPGCRCRNVGVELTTSGGSRRILDGVNLDVAEGEFVSIMGRSGVGKTTLLRVLGGLLAATPESQVSLRGRPVQGPPDGAVFLFQDYTSSLLSWRTVERNVALGLEGKVAKTVVRERVAEALALVALDERAQDYPWQLSGGMQQRVQLARALAMRPSLLLLDEPFGALDAMTRSTLQDELQRVHQLTGATVVFVSHDLDEAVYLSDRVVILEGSPASISREVTIHLARPRDQLWTREQPDFLELRRTIHDVIMRTDD